jgi:nanoRNase/pAp phosphatase (c-di-AMP/oligoRNAs hydrolase)
MALIARNFKGAGGGHDGAAGCYGFFESEDYLGEITPKIIEHVENYLKTLKDLSGELP